MAVEHRIRPIDWLAVSSVTLGDQAKAEADRYEIGYNALCLARAMPMATYEDARYVVAVGRLPDHRSVCCDPERPAHIVKLRLV